MSKSFSFFITPNFTIFDHVVPVSTLWQTCMTLHFSELNLRNHLSDHFISWCKSYRLRLSLNTWIPLWIFVLSANIRMLFLTQFERSFTKIRKNRGPNTEPQSLEVHHWEHLPILKSFLVLQPSSFSETNSDPPGYSSIDAVWFQFVNQSSMVNRIKRFPVIYR